MDRGTSWTRVHGVAKSWTQLSDFTLGREGLELVYIERGMNIVGLKGLGCNHGLRCLREKRNTESRHLSVLSGEADCPECGS